MTPSLKQSNAFAPASLPSTAGPENPFHHSRGPVENRQTWFRRVIGGLLISVAAICYLAWYRPAAVQLDHLRSQISDQQIQLRQIQLRAGELNKLQSEVDRLMAHVGPSDRVLPAKADLPAFINEIGAMCQQSAVRKFECLPGAVKRLDHLTEQKILLMFEGDFFNIFRFLQHAEELPQLSRVQSLSIKTRDAKLGQVEVRMAMNLYSAQ